MIEAILYEKLPEARVRCHVCQWRCMITPGKKGVCKTRLNTGGILQALNYAEISSANVDPIEKKPLYHFYPGTLCYSLGSWGCNFHCVHCQNWQISCVETPDQISRQAQKQTPQQAISLAKRSFCQGIAWTYNEPTMGIEYTLDSAKLAKKAGLYTVYVTNGYITPEGLDTMGPYLDAWRVDVKGFTDDLYKKLANVSNWRSVLEMAVRAQKKWGMHVEVVTNIIPTMNDDEGQLKELAGWICNELGPLTPWHVTRFYPHYKLNGIQATPIETLEKAYQIGKDAGLRFIYLGNVAEHESRNTICYSCNNAVVKRTGYTAQVVGVVGSKCKFCGAELNMRTIIPNPVQGNNSWQG
jgi:pyruvate formate lyase activating enzyme